ncbi:MAG: hypothetical protein ABR557_12170 [Pyrinomonadaceae bacterium]
MNKKAEPKVPYKGPSLNQRALLSDEDLESIDGCALEIVDETLDEELPPTEGGVA